VDTDWVPGGKPADTPPAGIEPVAHGAI
jgi:hypothetical protein